MKYQPGNILLLNNGKTVYVLSVDERAKKYQVVDTEDQNKLFAISEGAVNSLLT